MCHLDFTNWNIKKIEQVDEHNFLLNVGSFLWNYYITDGTLSCYDPIQASVLPPGAASIWKFAANEYGIFWINGPGDFMLKGRRPFDATV